MMSVAWVPTFRQFADGFTKGMADVLFEQFKLFFTCRSCRFGDRW